MSAAASFTWNEVLAQLLRHEDLDDATATAAMDEIMDGNATAAQVAVAVASSRSS